MKSNCYRKEIDGSSIVSKHCGLTLKSDLANRSKSRKWRFVVPLILLLLGAGLLGVSCTKTEESASVSISDLSEEER